LREGMLAVEVGENRDRLLAIKRGEIPFDKADAWRRDLQDQFESAFDGTRLPDRPDYEKVNDFLVEARERALEKSLP